MEVEDTGPRGACAAFLIRFVPRLFFLVSWTSLIILLAQVEEISSPNGRSRSLLRITGVSIIVISCVSFLIISIVGVLLQEYAFVLTANLAIHGGLCAFELLVLLSQTFFLECRMGHLGESVKSTIHRIRLISSVSITALGINAAWTAVALQSDSKYEEFTQSTMQLACWMTAEALPTMAMLMLTRSRDRPLLSLVNDPSFVGTPRATFGTETPGKPLSFRAHGFGWPMPLRIHHATEGGGGMADFLARANTRYGSLRASVDSEDFNSEKQPFHTHINVPSL